MAQEAELKIKHDSVEKTTSAIDALVNKLDVLNGKLNKLATENKNQDTSQTKVNTALKAAEVSRQKAVDMLGLHEKGLHKLSDAYAKEQSAIKAREIAAKKDIEVGTAEYSSLLKKVQATELATVASKRLAAETAIKAAEMTKSQKAAELEALSQGKQTTAEKAQQKALESSNINRQAAVKLLALEEKGLDRLSDEYVEAKAAITGEQQAKLKGLKTGTKEYNQFIKNTKAIDKSTAARKKLTAATSSGVKGASKFTNSLDDMAKQASLVDGPLGGIASRITTLSTILKSTGGLGGALAFTGVGIGIALFTQQLAKGIKTAIDSEVAFKTLEAQIVATGKSAIYSAEQLDLMARKIASGTLDNTENVRASITSLLSFTNISSRLFEDILRKSQDVAIAKGKSTKEVINQLGRAFDDPISKMKTLEELGIKVEGKDKLEIERLQDKGEIYKAQVLLFKQIKGVYGDIAKAQADTLAGDIDTLDQNWTEFFETMGNGANGPLRSVVTTLNDAVVAARKWVETDIETSTREMTNGFYELSKSSVGTEKILSDLKVQLEELNATSDDTSIGEDLKRAAGIAAIGVRTLAGEYTALSFLLSDNLNESSKEDLLLTDKEKRYKVLTSQIEKYEGVLKSLNSETESYVYGLTAEQLESKKLSKIQLEGQEQLTKAFLLSKDTQSDYYRKVKAGQDAITEAQKRGFDVNEESLNRAKTLSNTVLTLKERELKLIYETKLATAKLTDERVRSNTVTQKSKSIESQTVAIQNEIVLYKLAASGIKENSDLYLRQAASIKTNNDARVISGKLSKDEVRDLMEKNLSLLELQRSQKILSAIEAGGENGANVATLKRQIKLQELLSTGIQKTSKKYIEEEEKLKALEVVRRTGVKVGSDEYDQLLLNADIMARYRSELQSFQDIAALGITIGIGGDQSVEGTLESLKAIRDLKLKGIDDQTETVNQETGIVGGISSEDAQTLKKQVMDTFLEEENQLLLPFGFVKDTEGIQNLIGSVEVIEAEYKVRRDELILAEQEGEITNKAAFNQRLIDMEQEKLDKVESAKKDAWQKSATYKNLMLGKETADQAASGLETLSIVAGNNKKLAKMAKAASIFSASASLVDALSEAYKAGFPISIPLAAKAFAQGTALISQAKSLSEPSFAFGGVDIQGEGTGRSDSIKANIARGESVMTAPATSRYKDTLQRMNAGLPVNSNGGGNSVSSNMSIVIQGDASERTVGLIEMKLRDYEERVQQIAQGVSQESIQQENEVGGFLNPI